MYYPSYTNADTHTDTSHCKIDRNQLLVFFQNYNLPLQRPVGALIAQASKYQFQKLDKLTC